MLTPGHQQLTTCCVVAAIHDLGKLYRERYKFQNLRLLFNSKRGFYIAIPLKDLEDKTIPSSFVQVVLIVCSSCVSSGIIMRVTCVVPWVTMQVTKAGKIMYCATQELISVRASCVSECVV